MIKDKKVYYILKIVSYLCVATAVLSLYFKQELAVFVFLVPGVFLSWAADHIMRKQL